MYKIYIFSFIWHGMGLYIMHMLSCFIMTSVYAGEAFLKGALCSLYLRLGSGCWSCVIVLLSVSWLVILSPLWSFFHQWCWWLCTVSLHEFLLALSPPESDVFLFTRGSFVMSINCLGIQSIYPKISAILHFSKKNNTVAPCFACDCWIWNHKCYDKFGYAFFKFWIV